MKKSLLVLSLFTLLIGAIAFFLERWNNSLVYEHIIYFLIYYYIVSFLSISLINFAIVQKMGNLTLFFLGSMVGRFLLSIVVAFLFMILDKPNVVVIGVNFVILHLLFLGLDLFVVINKLKSFSSNDQDLNVEQNT